MQRSRLRDLIVGTFVLCGLLSISYMSIQLGGLYHSRGSGLKLYATFDQVGDLKERAAVQIAGVKVGEVKTIELDEFMRARCLLDLDPVLKLDSETTAAIQTAGLLGAKLIALEPGGSDVMLRSGDEISRTDSAVSLESLLGKFVNNSGI
jgi:phospholipid/cholesterol/gamma-HCH transport system substrate-binding protein